MSPHGVYEPGEDFDHAEWYYFLQEEEERDPANREALERTAGMCERLAAHLMASPEVKAILATLEDGDTFPVLIGTRYTVSREGLARYVGCILERARKCAP